MRPDSRASCPCSAFLGSAVFSTVEGQAGAAVICQVGNGVRLGSFTDRRCSDSLSRASVRVKTRSSGDQRPAGGERRPAEQDAVGDVIPAAIGAGRVVVQLQVAWIVEGAVAAHAARTVLCQ